MVKLRKLVFLLVILAVTGVVFILTKDKPSTSCTPIPQQEPETGNHGWLIWSNDFYKSFTPEQTGYCIETGWEPVGATIDPAGNALFPAESSGIFIKTTAFTSKPLLLADNKTSIRVLYPTHLTPQVVDEYLRTITAVFNGVSSLYTDFETSKLTGHTIMISVGIAGDANDIETSIYPTPTKDLTIFGRNLNHRRGEELFIHAVTHLFNRHYTEDLAYQENQDPIPASDWQEIEASWAEIIFLSDPDARTRRVQELYDIHKSVISGVFSPALEYPFNKKAVYDEVRRKSVILGTEPSYAEIQYSHYVLAPLALVSVDGLLEKRSASTSVQELIKTARTENKNFFILLQEYLSKDELAQVNSFIFGKEIIPYELLEVGISLYEQ